MVFTIQKVNLVEIQSSSFQWYSFVIEKSSKCSMLLYFQLLSVLLTVLAAADLAKALYDEYKNDKEQALVMFVTPAIQMATYVSIHDADGYLNKQTIDFVCISKHKWLLTWV